MWFVFVAKNTPILLFEMLYNYFFIITNVITYRMLALLCTCVKIVSTQIHIFNVSGVN